MATKMKPRPCSVYRCTRSQEWIVYYRGSVGTDLTTDSWAKVCRRHATDNLWPISWGTIIRREPIKR